MAGRGVAESSAGGVKSARLVFSANASLFGWLHSLLSVFAFAVVLALSICFHYHKIVKNQFYGFPEEWFPSVSATIGDWFPERNIFQICIAVTSGPRFTLVFFWFLLNRQNGDKMAELVALCGLTRTITCGGWIYITSSDHTNLHDMFMISYIALNIPWMLGSTFLTFPQTSTARIQRKWAATLFFVTLLPLAYYYAQHKVYRVAGAYSTYALFEWTLVFLDIYFDATFIEDLRRLEVRIVDVGERSISLNLSYFAPPLSKTSTKDRWKFSSSWAARLGSNFNAATSHWRYILSEIYMSFVFWSNLTGLGPMIFYHSVWAMGLSGEEVLLFSTLSPIFLLSRRIRSFLISNEALAHVAMCGGIAAFYIDDEGEVRLRVVSGAVGVGTLVYATKWYKLRNHAEAMGVSAITFLIGLLLTVLIKYANFSLNPMWAFMSDGRGGHFSAGIQGSNGGYNTLGTVLGCLAALENFYGGLSPDLRLYASSHSNSNHSSMTSQFWFSSCGFGSLIFLIHFLFTDAGTIISWAQTGKPWDVTAMPHGFVTILSLTFGISLLTTYSDSFPFLGYRHVWIGLSIIGSCLLWFATGGVAVFGGCLLAVYTMMAFPFFVRSAARYSPAWSFFVAFVVYGTMELAITWTVAYAFVPGGALLRERTDLVFAAVIAIINLTTYMMTQMEEIGPKQRMRSKTTLRDGSFVTLKAFRGKLNTILICVLLGSVGIGFYRRRLTLPLPYHSEERLLTAGIWTVHFALDGRMWESQRRMAHIIEELEIDVIGLLESDLQRIVMGNRDITQYMSHTLNMYADIGPGASKHTWGCAILSKFPIIATKHYLLPSPRGELAPALIATLAVYGQKVDVVVAHNGQEQDSLDRELQSKELGRLMAMSYPRPVIFLGYVVTKPLQERPAPYLYLVEDGKMLDIDIYDWDRWCEYVLFRGLHRVAYARINRGGNPSITDTELQLGKFVLPLPPSEVSSPSVNTSLITTPAPLVIADEDYNRVGERLVPPTHRFPPQFYDEGTRGHRFQILENNIGGAGPVYYLSIEEEKKRKALLTEEIMAEELSTPECKTQ